MKTDLDRRLFLSGAAASGLSAAVPSFGAVTLEADSYVNKVLRFSLSKPPHWQFLSVKAFNASLDETEERLDRPETFQKIRELNEEGPILVISKRSPRSKAIVPSIQVMADPPSITSDEYFEMVESGAPDSLGLYEDYELERPFEVLRINDRDFGHYVATCTVTMEGKRVGCRLHSVVTMSEMAAFTLAATGPNTPRDDCEQELMGVLASMRFASTSD